MTFLYNLGCETLFCLPAMATELMSCFLPPLLSFLCLNTIWYIIVFWNFRPPVNFGYGFHAVYFNFFTTWHVTRFLGVKTDLFSRIEEGKSFIVKNHKRVIDKINCHLKIATIKNSKLLKMFGWLSFSVWKCLSQSSLFVIIYCVIVNGQDYGYNNNGM